MRIVVAFGGNALLKRGEDLTAENQKRNVRLAAETLSHLVNAGHEVVITHGNGPQVGLLALQGYAYKPSEMFPLDILGAESEGMIGYMIEQELRNIPHAAKHIVTILTQIEVDRSDPAFANPTKPIGPMLQQEEAKRLAKTFGWSIAEDGDNFRRVVPSPAPKRILEAKVIEMLVDRDVIVICAGGGGIPVSRDANGNFSGVEGVIDKDHASALLASTLRADMLLLLTDVEGVYENWGTDKARLIREASPEDFADGSFAKGSMGPKVAATCTFVQESGKCAAIGSITSAIDIIEGKAGTIIRP